MKYLSLIKFDVYVWVLVTLTCLFLVSIWLSNGQILGGWDVGIPVLYPQKELGVVSQTWWDTHSSGFASPQTLTAVPFYLLLTLLDLFGIKEAFVQKLLIWIVMVFGSMSIFYIGKLLQLENKVSFLSALFYLFNLTSLMVWQRGVHNGMLMLLLAPLSLLIIVWGIEKRKYLSLICVNLVCVLLSYVFGGLGFLFGLWLLWSVYLAVVLANNWTNISYRNFILKYIFLLFFSWLLTNSWWLINFIESSKYIIGQFNVDEIRQRTSDVVVALQAQTDLAYVLRGLSKFYHYDIKDWGDIYSSPPFLLMSWLPVLIVFSTLITRSNYKNFLWRFSMILIFIVLMISKGVNAPFGELNKLAYDLFPLLAPLRNPYEKIGILLTIPYSFLFGLGLIQLHGVISKRYSLLAGISMFAVLIMSLVFLVWPLWFGKIFVSQKQDFRINLPDYYGQANEWIKTQDNGSRIAQLPISPGESIDYSWGYSGVEPSQYLFDASSIGYMTGIAPVDRKTEQIIIAIHQQDNISIAKSLASMNVGWIILHNEAVWKSRGLEPPDRISKWLASNPEFLEYQTSFGPLDIWKIKDEYRGPKIYALSKLTSINKDAVPSSVFWKLVDDNKNNYVLTKQLDNNSEDYVNKTISKKVLITETSDHLDNSSTVSIENALKELPYVRVLPDAFLYRFIRIKERIIEFIDKSNPTNLCLTYAGKRLVESVRLDEKDKIDLSLQLLNEYENMMKSCSGPLRSTLRTESKDLAWKQELINILSRQMLVLKNSYSSDTMKVIGYEKSIIISAMMDDLELTQMYKPQTVSDNSRLVVYKINISNKGTYKIRFYKPSNSLLNGKPVIKQIDNKMVNIIPVTITKELIEFPVIDLESGIHTLHLNIDLSSELIPIAQIRNDDKDIKINRDDKGGAIYEVTSVEEETILSFKIDNIDIEQTYTVSFDYLVSTGSFPEFNIVQNSDPYDMRGEVQPRIVDIIRSGNYDFQWDTRGYNFHPTINTVEAILNLVVSPSVNCDQMLQNKDCSRVAIKDGLNRSSSVSFKNIKVEKRFQDKMILEEEEQLNSSMGNAQILFKKNSSTEYELQIENQLLPYLLVFSETYHPGWELVDNSGNSIEATHFMINGYANGWVINDELPTNLKIKYRMQQFVAKGVIISGVSMMGLFILLLTLDRNKNAKYKR